MENDDNDRSEIPVVKPVPVKLYNIHMGGVDRVEQQCKVSKFFLKHKNGTVNFH